ncbi:MAG: CDP-diacylglycerol--serine O-phosphatidyltransferase [Candidatus Schekmanbacteria bacterium]|nr:CDP-diacylglycerol--serine O-phosphatidyltransferase [Candidatus Schekmanbacteria bacterium]
MRKGIYILPSLFTTGNALCGFYAIIASINGMASELLGNQDAYRKWLIYAAYAIILGAVFDCFDGKVARTTKTTSRFGVEFDSLADLVTFGVAPGVLVYIWALKPYGKVGWIASFLFVICGALRLARYNVQTTGVKSKYFTGLPIPAAAGVVASLVIFYFSYWQSLEGIFRYRGILTVIVVYVVALLMVSTLKFRSFSGVETSKSKHFNVLIAIIFFIFIVIMKPNMMLFLMVWGYFFIALAEALYLFIREKTALPEGEKGTAFEGRRRIYRRKIRKNEDYGTDQNI